MRIGTQERGKLIALLALAAICAFFVYRSFFLPEEPRVPASFSAESNASGDADSVPGSRRTSSPFPGRDIESAATGGAGPDTPRGPSWSEANT